MATIAISSLPTQIPNGQIEIPATDPNNLSSATTGTTGKYLLSEITNFILGAQGLTTYTAALVATTGALTATYSNGTSGVGATLTNATTQAALVLDGITLAVGNRVLVWEQASTFQNGIYTVTSIGSASTNWVLTRSIDYDTPSLIIQYGVVLVDKGATYAGKLFQETGAGPFTIGTTPIIFSLYATSGQVDVGTINDLAYYAASGSAVSPLTTANSAALVTSSTGVPGWSSTMTNGQLIIGSTGATPAAVTLTAGTGVSISNGANSITINAAGGGMSWTTTAGTTQAAAVNNGYISGAAGQTTFTLPATAAIGDHVAIEGLGAGGWILAANTGQTIKIGTTTTSSAGHLTSAASSDNVYVICIVANTTWRVITTNSTGLTVA